MRGRERPALEHKWREERPPRAFDGTFPVA